MSLMVLNSKFKASGLTVYLRGCSQATRTFRKDFRSQITIQRVIEDAAFGTKKLKQIRFMLIGNPKRFWFALILSFF